MAGDQSTSQTGDPGGYELEQDDFRWLSRAGRGLTYNSLSFLSHLPACSFDWGKGGYAGSSNIGGELLSLSQPSRDGGVIIARGIFSKSLYASLYQTQIEFGGPATFGLELLVVESKSDESRMSFQLGDMIERGCFNYRWPLNEYYLDRLRSGPVSSESGGISASSQAAEAHVLRVEEHGPFQRFPEDAHISLNLGGPVWLEVEKFSEVDEKTDEAAGTNTLVDMSDGGETMRYYDEQRHLGLEAQVYQLDSHEATGWRTLRLWKSHDVKNNGGEQLQKQGVNAYNALGAIEPLDSTRNHDAPNRSAVFLAAIRLFEGGADDVRKWPRPPTSAELADHIGGGPEAASQIDPQYGEINLIGRSLEKVLQVDLVPATFGPAKPTVERYGWNSAPPLALVSNIFIRPTIDLKSLFWKMRLLVQAYLALASHPVCPRHKRKWEQDGEEEPSASLSAGAQRDPVSPVARQFVDDDDDDSHLCRRVKAQINRIRTHVCGILQYLSMALLSPKDQSGVRAVMMPPSNRPGDLSYYYVMTTVWYVLRNLPGTSDWGVCLGQGKQPVLLNQTKLYDSGRLPGDDWPYVSTKVVEAALLQWFHYGSIQKLRDREIVRVGHPSRQGLDRKVRQLEKLVKTALAANLASGLPYVAEDEIIDRLSFLAAELGLETSRAAGHATTVRRLASKCIRHRDSTSTLKPGWVLHEGPAATSGLWEIHALCHHSLLVSAQLDGGRDRSQDLSDSRSSRRSMSAFLNAEGTLIPCWERDHESETGGWLRSETSAVVATTLLMLGCALGNETEQLQPQLQHDTALPRLGLWSHPRRESVGFEPPLLDPSLPPSRPLVGGGVMGHVENRLRAIETFTTEQHSRLPAIDWMMFRPPRIYYPNSFTRSLESSPDKYTEEALSPLKTRLPSALLRYVSPPGSTGFSWDDLNENKDLLESLRVWDVITQGRGPSTEVDNDIWAVEYSAMHMPRQLSEKEARKRLQDALYRSLVNQEVQHRVMSVTNLLSMGKVKRKEVLDMLSYVLHPESVKGLGNHMMGFNSFLCQSLDEWVSNITLTYWKMAQQQSQQATCDSRATTIPTEGFAPEEGSASTLTIEQSKEGSNGQYKGSAAGRLELAPHSLQSQQQQRQQHNHPDHHHHHHHDKDDDEMGVKGYTKIKLPSYAPQKVKDNWCEKCPIFDMDGSSMVISTNAFGDFSMSTVISDLLGRQKEATAPLQSGPGYDTADKDWIAGAVKTSRDIWQQFIHQPQTARCLVFLLALGRMSEKIEWHCGKVLVHIDKIREDWKEGSQSAKNPTFKSNHAATSLYDGPDVQKMNLWALGSLKKIQRTLKSSIATIVEAKESLFRQVEQLFGTHLLIRRHRSGPGKRDADLERICQRHLDAFNGSLAKLNAGNAALEERVASTTCSIETGQRILELDYNEAAEKQNSSLQRLTSLTIGYLPVTMIATVFAIPSERNVLADNMDLHWFLIIVVVVCAITYVIAANLGAIDNLYMAVRQNLKPSVWLRWLLDRIRGGKKPRKPDV